MVQTNQMVEVHFYIPSYNENSDMVNAAFDEQSNEIKEFSNPMKIIN